MVKELNRDSVLLHTLWGVDIYAHILRQYYPGETVIRVIGRDCGICRNPFAGGARNLHIWYEKINPTSKLSNECAHHHDDSGTIPDGNALDFAALHYKQSGQQLLDTINREMYLHLGEPRSQYANAPSLSNEQIIKGPRFSFFKGPITNTKPLKSITILDAYNYIVGPYAKDRTEQLRSIEDKKKAKIFKASRFDYATFCGVFDMRHNDHCITPSGLLCIDFDHLDELEFVFPELLKDRYFETALLFRSPSGDGLKWIIEIDRGSTPHSDYCRAISQYIFKEYQIEADPSGKDISRACFLPYDPHAYINPNFR